MLPPVAPLRCRTRCRISASTLRTADDVRPRRRRLPSSLVAEERRRAASRPIVRDVAALQKVPVFVSNLLAGCDVHRAVFRRRPPLERVTRPCGLLRRDVRRGADVLVVRSRRAASAVRVVLYFDARPEINGPVAIQAVVRIQKVYMAVHERIEPAVLRYDGASPSVTVGGDAPEPVAVAAAVELAASHHGARSRPATRCRRCTRQGRPDRSRRSIRRTDTLDARMDAAGGVPTGHVEARSDGIGADELEVVR